MAEYKVVCVERKPAAGHHHVIGVGVIRTGKAPRTQVGQRRPRAIKAKQHTFYTVDAATGEKVAVKRHKCCGEKTICSVKATRRPTSWPPSAPATASPGTWSGESHGINRAGMGVSAGRVLPREPVHRLPEKVGMTDMPGVLLDHVDHETAEARVRDRRARCGRPTDRGRRRPVLR